MEFLWATDKVEMFRQSETRKSLPINWLDEHATILDDELNFLVDN